MPELLRNALAPARGAKTLDEALEVLLSLGGHVPTEVSRGALTTAEAVGLATRFERPRRVNGPAAFTGVLGLTSTGKVVIGVPDNCGTEDHRKLFGVAAQVPWTREDVAVFELAVQLEQAKNAAAVAACRAWLAAKEAAERAEILAKLRGILLHSPPVLLYREDRVYTNFREQNNLTGKSLFPGHPDCALHGLERIPVSDWSDDQTVLVTCFTLLSICGVSYWIEDCNGMQLTLRRVAEIFHRKHRLYTGAGGQDCAAAVSSDPHPAELEAFAGRLAQARGELLKTHLMYRRIYAPILNRQERLIGPGDEVTQRESAVLRDLGQALPLQAASCAEAVAALREESAWLTRPHGDFRSGLEDLIYQLVIACTRHFRAHFSLSRGFRSLPMLSQAVRAKDWARICAWELPEFFCCVVPSRSSLALFGGSWKAVADAAWSMSARMQFNSWHFLAGNLPKVAVVEARDYLTPPAIPDVSDYSDQHHRGHVYNKVRFTIRSSHPVMVAGRQFKGLVDLRLLRCDGDRFEAEDVRDAHRLSRILAVATECVADRIAQNADRVTRNEGIADIKVHAFDHGWHRDQVARRLR